jgi:hypothetical protein
VIPDIDPDFFARMGLERSAAGAKKVKEQAMPGLSPGIQRDVWDSAFPVFFDGIGLAEEIAGDPLGPFLYEPARKDHENELNALRSTLSEAEWNDLDFSISRGLDYIYSITGGTYYLPQNNIYAITERGRAAIDAAQRRLLKADTRRAVDSAIERLCSENPAFKSHVAGFETQLRRIASSNERMAQWKKVFPLYFRARLIELHRLQARIVNETLMPSATRKAKKEKIESLKAKINIDTFILRTMFLCYGSPYSFR